MEGSSGQDQRRDDERCPANRSSIGSEPRWAGKALTIPQQLTAAGGENGQACAGFLRRAAQFYAGYGLTIERVMTDNAVAYTRSRLFTDALADLGAAHKPIKPRCPWTNGKAERFNRTLAAEWAYAAVYNSSAERVAALPAWLHGYNHHQPHTALGGHPPTHRVNNLCPGDS